MGSTSLKYSFYKIIQKQKTNFEKNAAILIKDSEARKQLVVVALELLKDKTKQLEISKALKQLEKPNATLEIVDVCESIVERKRKRKSKVEN